MHSGPIQGCSYTVNEAKAKDRGLPVFFSTWKPPRARQAAVVSRRPLASLASRETQQAYWVSLRIHRA